MQNSMAGAPGLRGSMAWVRCVQPWFQEPLSVHWLATDCAKNTKRRIHILGMPGNWAGINHRESEKPRASCQYILLCKWNLRLNSQSWVFGLFVITIINKGSWKSTAWPCSPPQDKHLLVRPRHCVQWVKKAVVSISFATSVTNEVLAL